MGNPQGFKESANTFIEDVSLALRWFGRVVEDEFDNNDNAKLFDRFINQTETLLENLEEDVSDYLVSKLYNVNKQTEKE